MGIRASFDHDIESTGEIAGHHVEVADRAIEEPLLFSLEKDENGRYKGRFADLVGIEVCVSLRYGEGHRTVTVAVNEGVGKEPGRAVFSMSPGVAVALAALLRVAVKQSAR